MKFINLTSLGGKTIVVNVEFIGHLYRNLAKMDYGRVVKEECTTVGVTTHNNGGFDVVEDVDQIFKLIHKAVSIM
jgi:hypothetical protein